MAQLTDDCFAFGGRLIPLEEALQAAAALFKPIEHPETIALTDALGRIAATTVLAPRAVPPHDNAAVDGYAVRHADLKASGGETVLPLSGYAAAGDQPAVLPKGTARRILTGAAMPPGSDTVFMDEDVQVQGDQVHLPAGLRLGANARKAGEDIARGAEILAPGRRLVAADLGTLASVGLRQVDVQRRLRVALFSTGNEIREPGDPLDPGQVYDANRQTLRGLLQEAGAEVLDLGILPDQPDAIEAAFVQAQASQVDMIITSGGVSAGDHDVVRMVLDARGELLFWRLAVKPGRPLALGHFEQTPLIGLPGNPAAAAVMFYVAALPLLRAREGALPRVPYRIPVALDFSHRKKADRVEYVRVQVSADDQGKLIARKFAREGAGLLSSIAWADGLIALEPDRLRVEPGEMGWFTAFNWSMSA